jgi:hypothetical protein
MAERRRKQLQLRRVAIALLDALLPTLSYFGHWPVAIRFTGGPLQAVPAAGWVPTRQHTPLPEHGPPRRHASTPAAS